MFRMSNNSATVHLILFAALDCFGDRFWRWHDIHTHRAPGTWRQHIDFLTLPCILARFYYAQLDHNIASVDVDTRRSIEYRLSRRSGYPKHQTVVCMLCSTPVMQWLFIITVTLAHISPFYLMSLWPYVTRSTSKVPTVCVWLCDILGLWEVITTASTKPASSRANRAIKDITRHVAPCHLMFTYARSCTTNAESWNKNNNAIHRISSLFLGLFSRQYKPTDKHFHLLCLLFAGKIICTLFCGFAQCLCTTVKHWSMAGVKDSSSRKGTQTSQVTEQHVWIHQPSRVCVEAPWCP